MVIVFLVLWIIETLSYKINGTSLNTELLLLALQTTWPWSIALTIVLPASKTKSGQCKATNLKNSGIYLMVQQHYELALMSISFKILFMQ